MIGKTLGHYEIISQLGKGGMGEVYQAKDKVLGRDVAIKVLPEEFAKDADRVARFQREAKLLASLNHPNIAAIYGLEESGGTNFLVLELIEGDTLADRIKGGPIPVEESLKLALQIAEALEAAHEKGVIHRDLKPANIKVTPDGKVKVLDFGLAKAFAGEQEQLNLSNSPTLSNATTQQGIILGTAGYMSPEQASGKTVDKRADIWAFGVVLFEMLTGRSLFAGDNVSQTLARVLERQPDFSFLPPNLHFKVVELLKRCLQKESRNRYHDIADIRLDLQEVLADSRGVFVQPIAAAKPQKKLKTILPWAAATLILGLVIAGVAAWKLKPSEPRQVVRFEFDLPEGQELFPTVLPNLAVSPDGKEFAYATTKGIYLRSLSGFAARFIPGTEEGALGLFFSPDAKWIGYFSRTDQKLKKISVIGGTPVALCDTGILLNDGADWNEDNTIVYGKAGAGIVRVSGNGGTAEAILKIDPKSPAPLLSPQILPGGKSVLYTASTVGGIFTGQGGKIMVHSLKSGETRELFEGRTARYVPTGHIIYALASNNISTLFAVPFNLDRLEVTGETVRLIEGVRRYAISDSGTLVYVPSTTLASRPAPMFTLVWADRKGKEEPIADPKPGFYPSGNISPDGTKLVYMTLSGSSFPPKTDIWVWDFAGGTPTRLTFNESSSDPLWTPDGKRIVYLSGPPMGEAVYWKAADGRGQEEKLFSDKDITIQNPCSWSRDGKLLLLAVASTPGGSNQQAYIATLSMEGEHNLKPLIKEEKGRVSDPTVSPDGRWIAYTFGEPGKSEVYVRPFPEVDKGKWQISTNGGESPLWSRDGRELFYRNGDSAMAVFVQTVPTFKPIKAEILFQGKYTNWGIHPDGKRFLLIKRRPPTTPGSAPAAPNKINVVVNWIEELKQHFPAE